MRTRKTINGNADRVPFEFKRMFQDLQLDERAIREQKAFDARQQATALENARRKIRKAEFEAMMLGKWTACTTAPPEPSQRPPTARELIDRINFLLYDIPKERFTTYEPSDLGWLEYFGLAKKKPTFDTVVVPPGTMVKQSAAGTFKVCESEHCPEGVGYFIDSKAYAVDSLPMLTCPVW